MALNKIRRGQSYLTHARVWYLIDAKDQILGLLGGYLGQILTGKHKPIYSQGSDIGDHVVVTNTRHIVLTENKWKDKVYRHHTGYPGGLKEYPAITVHYKNPTVLMWRAVYGMLPKNGLRVKRMERLHLFADDEHPYEDRIYLKLKPYAPIPKRLEEYTPEEIKKYPKLF